jgi:hypothetical protein
MVLGVGIDWAEAFHLLALGHPDEGVIETRHGLLVERLVQRRGQHAFIHIDSVLGG